MLAPPGVLAPPPRGNPGSATVDTDCDRDGDVDSMCKWAVTYRIHAVSITITVKVYHCADGDRPFDGKIGFGSHFVHKCKFDSDGDEDGICKQTF